MSTSLLKPIGASDWNARAARHLLNRAGFGLTHERAAKLAGMTPAAAVDYFVDYEEQPENGAEPDFVIPVMSREESKAKYAGLSEEERRKAFNEYQREEREAIQRLKGWWLARMYRTERPLQEKLTLFWHGHFATSAQKVKSSQYNYEYNRLLRTHAGGNFKALTTAVGQSHSMLRYLDNVQSTKKSPNENWARELMELFTLGQGQYSEDDIKNSARAFTGWSYDYDRFVYRVDQHDQDEKAFMGKRGNLDGWDVLDIIFEQPAASKFIAHKLWTYFAYEDPQPEIVEGLAATLRENGYELRPMLRQMFNSRAFYSEKCIGTQVKSPAQTVLQLASDLEYENPPYTAMARATATLGQDLFFPPNVKGWDGNRAWINANTLLIRYNLPGQIIAARKDPSSEMRAAYLGQAGLDSSAGADPAMEPSMTMMEESAPAPAPVEDERWTPQKFIQTLDYRSVGDLLDSMTLRFLSVPLSTEQRAVLLEALAVPGGESTTVRRKNLNPRNAYAALHLLLSTAEYQLC